MNPTYKKNKNNKKKSKNVKSDYKKSLFFVAGTGFEPMSATGGYEPDENYLKVVFLINNLPNPSSLICIF
jgi:hypothetical protein